MPLIGQMKCVWNRRSPTTTMPAEMNIIPLVLTSIFPKGLKVLEDSKQMPLNLKYT